MRQHPLSLNVRNEMSNLFAISRCTSGSFLQSSLRSPLYRGVLLILQHPSSSQLANSKSAEYRSSYARRPSKCIHRSNWPDHRYVSRLTGMLYKHDDLHRISTYQVYTYSKPPRHQGTPLVITRTLLFSLRERSLFSFFGGFTLGVIKHWHRENVFGDCKSYGTTFL